MTSEEATAAVIDALEVLGIPYMLTGSLAANYYGIPRATQDADFVVQLPKGAVSPILERLGPGFRFDPQMAFELATGTTRYVLRPVDTPFEIELFLLSEDEHDQARFARRRRATMLNRPTFLPTVEDVIVTKLRWSRQGRRAKDMEDAKNVIALQGSRVDWDYVQRWCDRHGTRGLLEEASRSLPPD